MELSDVSMQALSLSFATPTETETGGREDGGVGFHAVLSAEDEQVAMLDATPRTASLVQPNAEALLQSQLDAPANTGGNAGLARNGYHIANAALSPKE